LSEAIRLASACTAFSVLEGECTQIMDQAPSRKLKWGALVGGLVTVVSLIGGLLGIKQYYAQNPSYDVSGTWIIETTTLQTSYTPYKNLALTYTVQFVQNGVSITGHGEKTTESGHEVAAKAHTPILLTGTLAGDSIDAAFTEKGLDRESHGEFRWKLDKEQRWEGTFTSTAANSQGSSVLRRQTSSDP
jgi:hypothetical protein